MSWKIVVEECKLLVEENGRRVRNLRGKGEGKKRERRGKEEGRNREGRDGRFGLRFESKRR